MTKCANYRCDNTLPEYRAKRVCYQPSKWWFCLSCLKNTHMGSEPLRFKCARQNCDNLITWGNFHTAKCCSPLCSNRWHFKTGLPELKPCIECGNWYETNLGYAQKFCSKECRLSSSRLRRNEQARKRHELLRIQLQT